MTRPHLYLQMPTAQLLLLIFSMLSSVCLAFHHRSAGDVFMSHMKRPVTREMMHMYSRRVRRAEPDCSNEAETNADLQQAIATMITGNEAKKFLTQTQTPKLTVEMDKSALCEEDDGPDDISPDMPIRDRALCAFQYVENHNKQRLPQTIPEVQCLCAKPTNRMILRRFPEIHCEPIYYSVPVLQFESTCAKFEQTTERISLACVPVLSSQSSMNVIINTHNPQKAEVPTKK